MHEDVFQPGRLLLHYILCGTRVLHLEFIDELTGVADFSSDARDTELSQSPVILVTSDCKAHDLLTRALESSFREGCVLANLREDRQDTWRTLLDVVGLASVERINERVAVGVDIDDERHLFLLLSEEIPIGAGLRLRESLLARIVIGAGIVLPVFVDLLRVLAHLLVLDDVVNLAEVDTKVAIQVYTHINTDI